MFKASKTRVSAAACISAGVVRRNNEDNFYLNGRYLSPQEQEDIDSGAHTFCSEKQRRSMLLGVFDGIGGEAMGEAASFQAARCASRLQKLLKFFPFFSEEQCAQHYFRYADRRVSEYAAKMGGKNSGCTGAILWISGGTALAANVGDSRIYHIRGQRIRQLSRDHTQLQYMVDNGAITAQDAAALPRSHALTSFLGMQGAFGCYPEAHIAPLTAVHTGDIFILCSDGLTDEITDSEILSVASESSDASAICSALVGEALKKGAHDNTTVIAARIF